ncbi:MAG: hypothetical protein ACLPVO_07990 [Desulfomonilaceae bacterium]|nr:hypothetical protein [Syntrophaceae bacterium]
MHRKSQVTGLQGELFEWSTATTDERQSLVDGKKHDVPGDLPTEH